ncbi:PQQ-dependent sugar dehydrogenase [Stieleria sp. ICT_E10.1]|uniref:PQQ-dependent sugar dehydrogenase n=1 Tax=Stieleria sedimenti TaxID=2976331 RepID=UPI0021806F68|nr:PQQ-dependent sugar dehydrogenase [Stieleria sedimenti]MCS7470064.1 PQQ-dependent sugar dehydrogenase [Stieleria sedimenti]
MQRLTLAGCFLVISIVSAGSPAAPPSVSELARHALTHAGDARRGKQLFDDERVTRCLACHQVGPSGGKVGPDLSKIGGKFDRIHLIESLLEPSRQIVQGYQTRVVLTSSGDVRSGVITQENKQFLLLHDSAGKQWRIARGDIESIKPSATSTMPDNLAKELTKQQFTDLIAYLETLRTGVGDKFGSATRGPIQIPTGYEIQTLVTGLSGATAMEVLDDGRVLVCEQDGHLRVVKHGKLLEQPMLTLDVEHHWERGLIGVTVHPDFPATNWLYVCYVVNKPFTHHRVSRFRVRGDVADPSSEEILLRGDDQSKFGGNVPAGHQGGALHFGPDRKLYVSIGEQTAKKPAQDMKALQGKILCLLEDGSIPLDNPFVDQTEGKYQAIWALGCRNPFTFAIDPVTGRMLINDVGGKFEEINPGVAGTNYGWPDIEHGPIDRPGYTGPIHHYREASIAGGDFAPDTAGAELAGRYVFADFVHGWIRSIDARTGGPAETFAGGLRRPVDLRFSPDGTLYVLLRNAWVVDDKFQRDSGSLLRISRR